MIYAIVPLEKGKDLEEVVKNVDEGAYMDYAPQVYFVSYKGSSAELVQHLGFTSKSESPTTGLVLRVGHHQGYANSALWEWMLAHQDFAVQ